MILRAVLISLLLVLLFGLRASALPAVDPAAWQAVKAAQAFRAKGQPVQPAPDGTYFCEAEEFRVRTRGWQAKPWGENAAAATCANTFLSRKAFLGAPAQCRETTATLDVEIREAGRYLVLVRYEAAYRFETQFRVQIRQEQDTVFDRLYGARANIKIWWRSVTERLVTERANNQGIVWEGHDAYATLRPGRATITLIAGAQPEDAAPRNVDLVMLTRDAAQVQMRLEKSSRYLPLDGWLTQAGDVWMRVRNSGPEKVTVRSLQLQGGPFQQHSPYWVHIRNWQPVAVEVDAGRASDWVEVGSTMDTLNDGQWGFHSSGRCDIEFGLMTAGGTVAPLRTFRDVNGNLPLVGLADVRYSRRIPTAPELNGEILAYLKRLAPSLHGRPPRQTLFFAYGGWAPREWEVMRDLYGLGGRYATGPTGSVHWHYLTLAQLEGKLKQIPEAERPTIINASLGDEIAPPAPPNAGATEGFVAYLKARGLTPDEVDPTAGGDWAKITYMPDAQQAEAHPRRYYWSWRYRYHYGIQAWKAQTDLVRRFLPNAHVGINYTPHGSADHSYLGQTYQWVTVFRDNALTQAWSEDWAWQVPIGTQQMNNISVDLLRAGLRHTPERPIQYYVMAHVPGNHPDSWRRMFFSVMGHGATIFNLFELGPVWCAYTENHVTGNAMYAQVLRTLYEYGLYEDIIQTGRVRQANVGLWFSETGDIWRDNLPPFAAAKRSLYIGILHRGMPLDIIVEQDALDGTLDRYRVLYLADRHVSRAASARIAAWVRQGGRLFATAGAGMFDEYHQPNTVLRELLGVDLREMVVPAESPLEFVKRDLPFASPVETVNFGVPWVKTRLTCPAYGAISRVAAAPDAAVAGTFSDGSPAVIRHRAGLGSTVYCAFLPGLSYFAPATPRRPLDLTSRADSLSHFIPTQFDQQAGTLLNLPLSDMMRPVSTSHALVEASIIESTAGTAIVLNNWSGKPVKRLQVRVTIPAPTRQVSLATGKPVKMKREGDHMVLTFDLEMAGDVVILR